MSLVIDYYLAPQSPWTYFGHARLVQMAKQAGATVRIMPVDLGGQIFPATGGLPVGQRPPQRQAYRLVELQRFSHFLQMPFNLKPKFFPVAGDDAALLIIAVDQHMRAPAMSLTTPMAGEEGRPLQDIVPDEEQLDPEQRVANSQLGELVQSKLTEFEATLEDDRERSIWRERLMAADPSSLSDIGDRFGVSKERIRQVEVRIKLRLKAYLEQDLGDEMDFDFEVAESS